MGASFLRFGVIASLGRAENYVVKKRDLGVQGTNNDTVDRFFVSISQAVRIEAGDDEYVRVEGSQVLGRRP